MAGSSDVRVSASSKSIQKRPSAPWGSCCCPSRRLPLGRYPQQKIEKMAAGSAARHFFNLLLGPRPRPPDGKTQNRALFPTRRVPPSQSPPFRRYARSRFAKPQNASLARAAIIALSPKWRRGALHPSHAELQRTRFEYASSRQSLGWNEACNPPPSCSSRSCSVSNAAHAPAVQLHSEARALVNGPSCPQWLL